MKKIIIKHLNSLKVKFIFINFIIFLLIIFGLSLSSYTTKDMNTYINNFNSVFIEIDNCVNTNDEISENYLDKVAELHNVKAAVVNEDGKVLLKSSKVKENIIDMQKIKEVFRNNCKDENFYQMYNITINNKKEKLLIWDKPSIFIGYNVQTYIMTAIAIISIIIIYIFINSKVKYIEKMSKGAEEFSKGNLDYRINKSGSDELGFLAKSMNSMALRIKENIRKEREQEKFKTELITNVSHDLRTPLTSIIAYLQLLDNEKITQEDKSKYCAICVKKSYKLKQLLDDLFEFSKLESNGITLKKNNVNVVEILEQSIGELFIEMQNKYMKLKKKFNSSNIFLNIDSMQIGRVFENLLSNAVKYGVEGTDIYVELTEHSQYVEIKFENEVIEEMQGYIGDIFKKFYRGDKARNSSVSGSGLGLAIAQNIVKLHGGKIYAECKNNVFSICVELKKDNI